VSDFAEARLMFHEFLSWWIAQMRTLLPGKFAESGWHQDALIVAVERLDDGAEDHSDPVSAKLFLRRGSQESLIRSLDFARPTAATTMPHVDTILRLPPGAVLERDVTLPLAAARDLQTVLGFEMDRLTPFAADEVYWGISGLTRDRARGRLTLRLSLVLRAPIEALCQSLAHMRLVPAYIETAAGRIALAPARRRQTHLKETALSALCGGLAIACIVTPFIRQQIALDRAAQAIAANAPAAQTALALRRQLSTAASGRAAIAQAQRSGDALQVLANLTDALPDDTWLSDLTLNAGDLTFDGQSANAAALIGRLSNVPGLRDPSFTAPVTRTFDGKADQFSLHATVGQ
jgi:general secretion pathway protein L